jgi:hypothetical protein
VSNARTIFSVFEHEVPLPSAVPSDEQLLQLRVLRLGLLQDGDVGVGVFPERKEILIGGAGFGDVP